MPRRRRTPLSLLTILALLAALTSVTARAAAAPAQAPPFTQRALLYASDGMRPDLMERYAAQGAMPTYASLMRAGVRGDNGLVQGFPPNTGVGWYTLATGTWPGEHGSTNNTFHRVGEGNFNNRTSFSAAGVLQADTIANAAERAGKKVAQVEWVGGRNANIAGPTVDFANFFSNRGVLTAPADPDEQAGAAAFGLSYQVAGFTAASGWTNVPGGDPAAPPKQTALSVPTTFAAQNPTRVYDAYLYDSVVDGTAAYDHAILVRAAAGKDGSQRSADLAVGDFQEVKLRGADGRVLREADRPGRRPVEVQALLHLRRAGDRELRHGRLQRPAPRWPRRGPARKTPRRRPADRGLGRLRPAGGPHHRREQLRPAGPRPGEALRRRGTRLRPGYVAARHRPRAGRLPGDRRVLAPVHGPGDPDRHRRRPQPVLRRPERGRGQGQPGGGPRGLHPQRLRRGGREARQGPRAARRQPDHAGLLRPRLRAAVAGRQRRQGAGRRRLAKRRAAEQLPRGRLGVHQGQGVLCRWDRADLRQPGRPRPRRGGRPRRLRDRARPDHQRLPALERPVQPRQAGHRQGHEKGGAARRGWQRLAAPLPQR